MMHEVASVILELGLEKTLHDVPAVLAIGKQYYPLGKYLRQQLRMMIGRSKYAPPNPEKDAEMQAVRADAFKNSESVVSKLLEASLGRRIQIEARNRRRKGYL